MYCRAGIRGRCLNDIHDAHKDSSRCACQHQAAANATAAVKIVYSLESPLCSPPMNASSPAGDALRYASSITEMNVFSLLQNGKLPSRLGSAAWILRDAYKFLTDRHLSTRLWVLPDPRTRRVLTGEVAARGCQGSDTMMMMIQRQSRVLQ